MNLFEKANAGRSKSRNLFLKAKGIEARGQEMAQGFVVRAGSEAVKEQVASIHGFLRELRRSLMAQGVLEDHGAVDRPMLDYTFNPSSNAAGVLLGRPANGRTEWKDAKGRILGNPRGCGLVTDRVTESFV